MMRFNAMRVEQPTLEAIRRTREDYETMLVSILDAILERHDRHPDYPFIDTKFSTITGEDFPEDSFKGRSAIFSWIQGRGLEALAGHAEWLQECSILDHEGVAARQAAIRRILSKVLASMESARARNSGHMFFTLNPRGEALAVDASGTAQPTRVREDACNVSDLFYAKGLFAAASWLGMKEKAAEAGEYFRRVVDDVAAERLYNDQQSFDPKNRVVPVHGRMLHGPRMLSLGGCSLLYSGTGDGFWLDVAARFIEHIVGKHVNLGQLDGLEMYDFVEAVDAAGRPWADARGVLSDCGHALEFLGFASKALLLMARAEQVTSERRRLIDSCRVLFPRVLVKNFRNGFNAEAGGICKAYDLRARRPINDDLPWWNLPETIRAAMLVHALAGDDSSRRAALEVLAECSNAFLTRFVNPRARLMAYQTRSAQGEPVDVIPATPDADPGYHTGLSIIDFLRTLDEAPAQSG